MRLFLLSLASLFCASSYANPSFEGRLPEDLIPQMKELISVALENSETMLLREYAEREAEGRRISARSAVLPTVRTNISFRQEREQDAPSGQGFEDRVVYDLSLRQPIYHWGTKRSEKEIGELELELARLDTGVSTESLVSKIRRDYLALVIARQRLTRSRLDLEEAIAKLAFQKELVEAGRASDVSVLPYELAVASKELDLMRTQSGWDFQLGELAVFTSIDVGRLSQLIAPEIPDFELLSSEAIESLRGQFSDGIEADIGLRKIDLDIEIDKRNLHMQNKSLHPMLSAEVGLSSNALDLDGTRREQSYSYFGLSVAWNVFDGFAKKGKSLETLTRLDRKERAKETHENWLQRKFAHALTRMEIESRSLAIQQRSLSLAQERFDAVSESVQEGRSPQSELENATRDFENTSIATQGARINYLLTLSDLLGELGLDSAANR